MLRRRTGWIGIDFGSRAVKVAQVERDSQGRMRLRQAAVISRQIPWPSTDAGMSTPLAPSAAELVAALSYGDRFTGRQAACTLPMHVHGFRGLQIPQGSLEERRNMLAATLEDAWDGGGNAYELDFWETDLPGSKFRQEEPNVSVMAVSRQWTRRAVEDASRANLRLRVLDGPPLAIARAVQFATPARHQAPSAAVDWGFTSTTFCVAQAGRALYTRRIRSCGLRLVCESIQASLGVSLEETQHLLLTFGLPAGDADEHHLLQHALAGAAREHFARLAEEIGRTLSYFLAQRRELIPTKIWLLGGGASVRNADVWLSETCGVPIEAWHLPTAEDAEAPAGQVDSDDPPPFSDSLLAGAIALSALPLNE